MMVVNETQFKRLGEIVNVRFYHDLMVRLKEKYPDFFHELDENTFLAALEVKKETYLFNQKSSIEFVAEYMILNGTDFDEKQVNPDIYELLQRNDIDGDEKIDKIYLLDLEHALEDLTYDES